MVISATEKKLYEASKLEANSKVIPLKKWIINQVDVPVAPILYRENNGIHSNLLQTLKENAHQLNAADLKTI